MKPNLIKLTKITFEQVNMQSVRTGIEPLLLNPAMIIKVETHKNGETYVTYREAMANGCSVVESLEEVYNLANGITE